MLVPILFLSTALAQSPHLSPAVRLLRQLSHSITESERTAYARSLSDGTPAPATLEAKIERFRRRFETVQCPPGGLLQWEESLGAYCTYRDDTDSEPRLQRWVERDEELLYAYTYEWGGEELYQQCSRLNLLTEELIPDLEHGDF